MFNRRLPENHAFTVLKKDHDTIKGLFEHFEKSDSPAERQQIVDTAVLVLKIHAAVEEEIFYPAVHEFVGDKLMNAAVEKHHVAKLLIAELDTATHRDERTDAKVSVLADTVRHHFAEEEEQILPRAKTLDIDFNMLGQRMQARRKELLEHGFPTEMEHVEPPAAGTSVRRAGSPKNRRSTMPGRVSTRSSPESKGDRKIHTVMNEYKEGELRSANNGKRVSSRRQPVAIALSEARRSGSKIPKKTRSS